MPLPKKMDQAKALKQRLKGMSYRDIAEAQGVDVSTVHKAIAPILKDLPGAEELAEMKRTMADHLGVTAYRAVQAITNEKLENSSAKDLGILSGILVDKQRIIDGLSTSNHQHLHLHASFQPIPDTAKIVTLDDEI